LRVGQNFIGDAVPRSSTLIDSFTARARNERIPVNGFENRDPAGFIRFQTPGLVVLAYASKPSPLQITPAKFQQFLVDEGLESVVALDSRAAHETPHVEQFTRYAKALLRVDGKSDDALPAPLGLRLELQPLSDPFAPRALSLRLLFEGKGLPGARVTAMARGRNERVSAVTDAKGELQLTLTPGVWLIKSTYIVAPRAGRPWETLWASLTFER
jgi:hypothetical protein